MLREKEEEEEREGEYNIFMLTGFGAFSREEHYD